uniref:Uncharacterized protein n=1 Tax=Panagrolaimus davidi TaxID=227884 RepID=A0A914QFT3_9BILA
MLENEIINSGGRRIGWAIKTTNMKRLNGYRNVVDLNEAFLMDDSCDSFLYGQDDTNNDRSIIEWTNTPDDAAEQFRRVWFQGDGMVRRKNLPIENNHFYCFLWGTWDILIVIAGLIFLIHIIIYML